MTKRQYDKDGGNIVITPTNLTVYDYKYNGKEWQDELSLNMYDMDMRQYDPAIARWVVQDPVIHHDFSPYSAFDNNPVFWADPSGADSERDYMGRDRFDSYGRFIAPNDRGEANFDSRENDNGDPKKKGTNKTGAKTYPNDSIDHFDGFTNSGDNSSPPLEDLSEEEIAKRNELFLLVVTAPLDATGVLSLTKSGIRFFSKFFIKKAAAKTGNLVKIGVVEGDVMMFSSKIGKETVEGITNFVVKDGKLYLNQLHLQGSSAGNVGREALWDMAKDLGRQYNVKEVIIQGGKRTTGKYKGQVPSMIEIKVN